MPIVWSVFGEAFSLLGFVGLFITAGGFLLIHRGEQASANQTGWSYSSFASHLTGGFGQNHHVAKTAFHPAPLVLIAVLFQGFGLFSRFQPFHFLLILAVFLRGKHVYQPVKQVGVILK